LRGAGWGSKGVGGQPWYEAGPPLLLHLSALSVSSSLSLSRSLSDSLALSLSLTLSLALSLSVYLSGSLSLSLSLGWRATVVRCWTPVKAVDTLHLPQPLRFRVEGSGVRGGVAGRQQLSRRPCLIL